jgi:hypothetical protein
MMNEYQELVVCILVSILIFTFGITVLIDLLDARFKKNNNILEEFSEYKKERDKHEDDN